MLPGCPRCHKSDDTQSWAAFQVERHHHLLRDFPQRVLLEDHLRSEGVDPESIHSTLAWRDAIADAWGHEFAREDGTYLPLYEAWLHGSHLMRNGRERAEGRKADHANDVELEPVPF